VRKCLKSGVTSMASCEIDCKLACCMRECDWAYMDREEKKDY